MPPQRRDMLVPDQSLFASPHRCPAIFEPLEARRLLAAHIAGSPTVYSTIQAAVDAAAAGATINVDAGTYPELVYVTKPLNLRGAQAGVDARASTRGIPATETILTGFDLAPGAHTSSFYINADDVTIDGFIAQSNTSVGQFGAGIVIVPGRSGAHILNNIIQNNIVGLYLANSSAADPAVIQHNLFRNNNSPGGNSGRGIYSDGEVSGGNLTNVLIDANTFIGNHGGAGSSQVEAAVSLESRTLNSQSNIQITNNLMDNNGKALLAFNASAIIFSGNTVTNCDDFQSAAVRFEGGITGATLQNNTIYNNLGPAIRIDKKAIDTISSGFTITGNNIYGNGDGLIVGAVGHSGVLNATNNWWGAASGPGGDGPGTGNTVTANGNAVTFNPWRTTIAPIVVAPYSGLALTAGDTIQAEDFDHGGEGVAYHDLETANQGGEYRATGVDVAPTTDTGGGYFLGWAKVGEWVAYTVNLGRAATYRADVRVASDQTTSGTFHLEVDGTNITGTLTPPNTNGWQTWATLSKSGLNLTAGPHILRLVFDSIGSEGFAGNFNWLKLVDTSPPNPPSNLTASAPTNTTIVNLAWQDNSNTETSFIIERRIGPAGAWLPLTTTAANVTTYNDATVSYGTTYSYRIHAHDALGDSSNSNEATVTPTGTIYLSDLAWVGTPTNGFGPVERDHSNGGQPAGDGNTITLDGITYAKGLGTHANSQIIYNLAGAYSSFIADLGIDDEEIGKGQGSVIYQVLADGQTIYTSSVISLSSPIQQINLNITGVQQLTLIVNDAGDGNSFDHADWAGARVIAGGAVPTTFSGSSGNDTYILRRNLQNGIELTVNGLLTCGFGASTPPLLTFTRTAGTDVIRVDLTNGNPLPTRLDINDLPLIVQATAATRQTALSDVISRLISSRAADSSGRWLGPGIGSTAAHDQSSAAAGNLTLGVRLNETAPNSGQPAYSTFAGQSIDINSILVRLSRAGDADLDGAVDGDDMTLMTLGATGQRPANWSYGDFTYSNLINSDDLTLFSQGASSTAANGPAFNPEPPPLLSAAEEIEQTPTRDETEDLLSDSADPLA